MSGSHSPGSDDAARESSGVGEGTGETEIYSQAYSAPESEHFTIAPVRTEPEGSRITLQPGFDAARVRVTGNVVGQPPFTGTLGHRGWQASDVRLPQLTDAQAARTLAQAEVEL